MTEKTAGPAPARSARVESLMVASCRDTLIGASTAGFVGCIVIGFKPNQAGAQVIGSNLVDAMHTLGALEMAKADVLASLRPHRTEVKV